MKAEQIEIGQKVWYYPYGDYYKEPAVITSEVMNICGSECVFIDTRTSVIDIENLSLRF